MNKTLQLFDKISVLRVKIPRLIDARKELNIKSKNIKIKQLDDYELQIVNNLWGNLRPNTKYLSLYNGYNEKFDPRYIPDDLYYGTVDVYFNNALHCAAIDDKNLYDLYFPDITQPKTIVRKINGDYQDEHYRLIDEKTAVQLCQKANNVVIKKSVNSDGGHGIGFWQETDGVESLRQLLFDLGWNFVVQEVIKQHENIAKLHPSSVNTIRILTLNWKGKVRVLSSIIRMGVDGNHVDNGHSGGIFAGIEDSGRLKNVAYVFMTGERILDEHPTTHTTFSECVIPNFDRCLDLVKKIAPRLGRVSRLTSWDLSVNENGQPLLIEVNLAYGALFFHQMANGPVFGDMTKEIIDEIIRKK